MLKMASIEKSDEKEAWKRVVACRVKESEALGITNTILHEFRNEEIIGDLNLDAENENQVTEDDIFIRRYLFEQLLMFHIKIMSGCADTVPSIKARRASWKAVESIFKRIDEEKQSRLAKSTARCHASENPTAELMDTPAPAASLVEAERNDENRVFEATAVAPSRVGHAATTESGSSSHFVPLEQVGQPDAPSDAAGRSREKAIGNVRAIESVPTVPRASKPSTSALESQITQENQLIQRKARRNGTSHSLLESYDLSSAPEKLVPANEVQRDQSEMRKNLESDNQVASVSHDAPLRCTLEEPSRSRNVSDLEQRKRHRSDETTFDHFSSHESSNDQWQPSGAYVEKHRGYPCDPSSNFPRSRSSDDTYRRKDWYSRLYRTDEAYGDKDLSRYRADDKDLSRYRADDNDLSRYRADESESYGENYWSSRQVQERSFSESSAGVSGRDDFLGSVNRSYESGRCTEFSPIRKKGKSNNVSETSISGEYGLSNNTDTVERNSEYSDVLREKVVMDSAQFLTKMTTDSLPSSKWNCQLCDCVVNHKNLPRHCKTPRHLNHLNVRSKVISQTRDAGLERAAVSIPNVALESENVGAMPPASILPIQDPLPIQDAPPASCRLTFPIDKYAFNIWADVKEWDPTRDKDPIVFKVKPDPDEHNFTCSIRPRGASRNISVLPVGVNVAQSQLLAGRLQEWDPFWDIKSIVCVGFTQPIQKVDPKTGLIKTASQHFIVKDLQEKYRDLKTTHGNWSHGDRVLLLRMLPESSLACKAKRADCHIWPKGTFLQINGTPCRIVQRKQQGHNESEWLYQSKEYNASSILTKTSGRGCIHITAADEEKFYYILTFCEYRDPVHVYGIVKEQINILSFPLSFRKARAFASQQMSISVDGDKEANGVDEAGKFIFTLTCPLSRKTLETPVRGKDCKHFQCFDLMCFINTNQFVSGSRWRCPSCELFVSLQNLESCALTTRLLKEFEKSLSADRDRIEFSSNGVYKLLEPKGARSVKLQGHSDVVSSISKKQSDMVVVDIDD